MNEGRDRHGRFTGEIQKVQIYQHCFKALPPQYAEEVAMLLNMMTGEPCRLVKDKGKKNYFIERFDGSRWIEG